VRSFCLNGSSDSSKTIAHKKGRCKRSGQGKTLDQELQINVSEHGAMNRIFDSSEIFHRGATDTSCVAAVYRGSQARISPCCGRKNTNSGHALLQPGQQSGIGRSSSGGCPGASHPLEVHHEYLLGALIDPGARQ
jgi:hypothetical protein